jgi:hypothetical protein
MPRAGVKTGYAAAALSGKTGRQNISERLFLQANKIRTFVFLNPK